MNTQDRIDLLFEHLSKMNLNIENVLKIAGLNDDATAWVMFAYVTPECDGNALDKVNAQLMKLLTNKNVDPELARGLVRIAIEERLTHRMINQRVRSAIIGTSQASYSRNRFKYDPYIDYVARKIAVWEAQAKIKIVEYNRALVE